MDRQFQALGHNVQISPVSGMVDPNLYAATAAGDMNAAAALQMAPPQGPVDSKRIAEGVTILQDYKAGKAALERRIVENERWYKLRHWDVVRQGYNVGGSTVNTDAKPMGDVEPTSAWLFNSLANKHADIMDNYPEPNVLPREQADEGDAKNLSDILPVILERNEFDETYSDAAWYKLKQGTIPYGVFWDQDKENGLGDISIQKLDLLNLFWKPGITDIQKSPNFFNVSPVDFEVLKSDYPWVRETDDTTLTITEYVHDESIDTSKMRLMVDWYYKRKSDVGKVVLHYAKFVGSTLLYATENDPQLAQTGLYDHGQYPFVFDVLFPEEDMPTGIGYIDIMRQPQIYIDKLDQIIMKNALMAGKKRWFIKDTGGVNETEYADWSNDFVHVAGTLDEKNVKEIDVSPLDGYIVTHKQMKIDELKETSGNRDFSQGGTSSGVTAAAAIAALQEAGNKLSRDMIKGSYRAYRKINYMSIELVRQFYDEARNFRIVGENNAIEYIQFTNATMRMQMLPPAYPGGDPGYRVPIFDIKVVPQKSNPFNKAAQNELAFNLYKLGFFDPARADQALAALDMMDIEGKQKLVQRISQNGGMHQQIQQLLMVIQSLTGVSVNGQGGNPGAGTNVSRGAPERTNAAAADNANTPYAQKMADRAKPDMGRQAGVKAQ